MDKHPPLTTGAQAVEYIHSFSWLGSRPGLGRTRQLLAAMGNPEQKLQFIHIVGTNGKGSTAAMLASVLTAAGYTTGLYTSPYIHHFEERMTVNGAEITGDELAAITSWVGGLADQMEEHPTEFELVTCVALEFFRRRGCDIVVLEAGMGGRLDSTNVIPHPEAAVITNIGLEHTKELGNTLAQIAAEKAGILKPGCRCVLYAQGEEASQVVRNVCLGQNIPLLETAPEQLEVLDSGLDGQTFRYRGNGPYRIRLLGDYQLSNAMTALDTVQALREGGWDISEAAVQQGLLQARWPGRLELVRRAPDVIIDGGHNPPGVLADKDWKAMFRRVLPMAKAFVAVTPDSPRALPAEELADWLRASSSCPVLVQDNLDAGVDAALSMAGPEDVVCAWGSLYSVGEIRHHLGLC